MARRPKRPIDMAKDETLEVSEPMIHELRAGVALREAELEKAKKYLTERQLGTSEIDGFLEIVRGDGPTRPGLKAILGFRDESDPNQMSLAETAEAEAEG